MSGEFAAFELECSVRIVGPHTEGKGTFDALMAQLCRGTIEHGSLRKAAQAIPISYSKAWLKRKEVERSLGVKLIDSDQGYGSVLTEDGQTLLRAYDAAVRECWKAARREYESELS